VGGFLTGTAILLMLVHLVGDCYGGFYGPLVPCLRERLHLSLTLTSALAALFLGVQSYLQPMVGLVEERFGQRAPLIAAILGSAVGMCLLGMAGSLWTVCAALVLGALAIGLFHPIGAALAGRSAEGNRVAAIAFYVLGGNLGVMLSPLIVTSVAAEGAGWFAALALPGLIFAAVLWARLPPDDARASRPRARVADIWHAFRKLWPIHLDMVLRNVPSNIFWVLLPLHGTLRGLSQQAAGARYAFFLLAGGAGVLSSGWLSTRVAARPLVVASEVAAGVCLLLAPVMDGALFYGLLGVGGFFMFLVTPLQIAEAQRLVPHASSAACGIVMGFAGGNASLLLIPLGRLGDHWTVVTGSELISATRMLQVSAGFLLVAAVAAYCARPAPADGAAEEA